MIEDGGVQGWKCHHGSTRRGGRRTDWVDTGTTVQFLNYQGKPVIVSRLRRGSLKYDSFCASKFVEVGRRAGLGLRLGP